jgi:hypothetical protein
MLTRSSLAIGATLLAAVAAVVANQDGDADIVPFFVGLTVLGGIGAWAVHEPYAGVRRRLAFGVGFVWLAAAVWIGALLVLYQVTCGCSRAEPPPEETYLGLTATVYHVAGLYLGGALIWVAAWSRWLREA